MIPKKLTARLAATVTAVCVAASATAADYTLKLHHLLSAGSYAQTTMLKPWADDIEEEFHIHIHEAESVYLFFSFLPFFLSLPLLCSRTITPLNIGK